MTICEAQDNLYSYSLSKSYTFPGNIVRGTMPMNLTRSVPDVCLANLGNYGLHESCLPISSYLSYYNIVTLGEKVKRKQIYFLNCIEIDINLTCTNNIQLPIPKANNSRCRVAVLFGCSTLCLLLSPSHS